MDIDVELCCFGMRLENERFSDLTYCNKSKSKFIWLGRTYELLNQGKRATLIIEEES
jgi:hypothetical protein